jgi:hypothetical protein
MTTLFADTSATMFPMQATSLLLPAVVLLAVLVDFDGHRGDSNPGRSDSKLSKQAGVA